MNIYKNGGVKWALFILRSLNPSPMPAVTFAQRLKKVFFMNWSSRRENQFSVNCWMKIFYFIYKRGEVLINYGVGKSAHIGPNQLFLFPKGLHAMCTPAADTRAVICIVKGTNLKVCDSYSQGMLEKQMNALHDTLHRNKFLCALTCNDMIKQYFKTLEKAFSKGISCLHFQCIKREELFLYLHMCYSLEELVYFFYPIMNQGNDFQEFVVAHYRDIRDVKELAEKAHMSVSTFSRKFKDTFNDTAQHWLLARRAELVLYDIVRTNDTFTEIAERHNFSSPAYLSNFCKQRFGKTPATLRKNWGGSTSLQDIDGFL